MAMALSSVSVVTNSLRVRKVDVRPGHVKQLRRGPVGVLRDGAFLLVIGLVGLALGLERNRSPDFKKLEAWRKGGAGIFVDAVQECCGRHMQDGYVKRVDRATIGDVNEALDLEIPEESDYETLGGFVLSAIGRFPSSGEAFTSNGVTFRVSEASDRRVLRVVLERPGGLELRREPGTPSTTTPRLASSSPGARSSKDGGLERRGA